MKKTKKGIILAVFLAVFALITVVSFTSCGGGGGGGGGSADPTSTSTQTPIEYGNITGVITNENGDPEKDTEVSWGIYSKAEGAKGGSTYTDADGKYTLTNVPAGNVVLTATKDNQAVSFSVEVKVDITVEAPAEAIEPVGQVSGTVINSQTGSGVSGAAVSIKTAGWDVTISKDSGSNGDFLIPYVEVGTHSLGVSKTGYSTASTSITVSAGMETEVPTSQTAIAPVSTPTPTATPTVGYGSIYGTVTDYNSGSGLQGVNVTAAPDINPDDYVVGQTGASGMYSLNVAAGDYTVYFHKNGYTGVTVTNVVVSAGGSVQLNKALKPDSTPTPTPTPTSTPTVSPTPTSTPTVSPSPSPSPTPGTGNITGIVRDNTSNVIEYALVSSGSVSCYTDATGTYWLYGLPPGTAVITATKTGYTNYSSNVHVVEDCSVTHNIIMSTE